MKETPEAAAAKPRVGWMDALRGIAIVLVVLDHSLRFVHTETRWDFLPVLDPISDALNPIRMPAMAFLSGLLLVPSLAKGPAPYLWGKVRNVAWPLLVWALVYKLVWIAAAPFTGTRHSLSDLLTVAWNPPGHLWYLRDLFLFYLIHLLLSRAALPRTPLMLGTAALSVVLCTFQEAATNNGEWQRFWFLLAFFTLGGWLSGRPGLLDRILARVSVRAAAFVAAAAMVPVGLALGNIRYEWESVPFTLGGIAVLALAAQALCRTPASDAFRFLGRNSLTIYVAHWLVVSTAAVALSRAAPWLGGAPTALAVFAAGLSLSVATVLLVRAVPVLDVLFSFPRRGGRGRGGEGRAAAPPRVARAHD
jgi:fucose 4-O-acetylase-like acetyltransferase